jgi:endonuclease-3
MSPADETLKIKIMAVYERLLVRFGERPLKPRREPMHELISTILSHRTTDANEHAAYDNMWKRFGSWEAIRDAPIDELIKAISLATFAEMKAPYIKSALTYIYAERGEPALDFLKDLPVEEGLGWLMKMPGVGIKTASLVLLFCFGKPVIPVDTHVHRISKRLGLIGPKVSADAAHYILLRLLPPDPHVLFNYHINNLAHGRQICVFNGPRCSKCPLTDLCDYYATVVRPNQ